MSRKLDFSVVNDSGHNLTSYTIVHSWNGKSHVLTGADLANNEISASIEITSGYTQYDWFAVVVNIEDIGYRSTQFYCNSSSYHGVCRIRIKEKNCDLRYFRDGKDDTGCNNKSYYEASVKFGNAEKIEGVCSVDE